MLEVIADEVILCISHSNAAKIKFLNLYDLVQFIALQYNCVFVMILYSCEFDFHSREFIYLLYMLDLVTKLWAALSSATENMTSMI